MRDDFDSLFSYNRWADRLVLDACRALSDEQYVAEPTPGWSSVRSTVVHIVRVTEGWLRLLAGEEVAAFLTEDNLPTLDTASDRLARSSDLYDALRPRLSPEFLDHPMTMRGGGRTIILPPWVVLRHVVNHSTYHRGQVASKLARLGFAPPDTDLDTWALEWMPPAG